MSRCGRSWCGWSERNRATAIGDYRCWWNARDKEDLFLASLGHYIETSGLTEMFATKPLGWTNVEKYLKFGLACSSGQKGCISVSSMRELAILPQEARIRAIDVGERVRVDLPLL